MLFELKKMPDLEGRYFTEQHRIDDRGYWFEEHLRWLEEAKIVPDTILATATMLDQNEYRFRLSGTDVTPITHGMWDHRTENREYSYLIRMGQEQKDTVFFKLESAEKAGYVRLSVKSGVTGPRITTFVRARQDSYSLSHLQSYWLEFVRKRFLDRKPNSTPKEIRSFLENKLYAWNDRVHQLGGYTVVGNDVLKLVELFHCLHRSLVGGYGQSEALLIDLDLKPDAELEDIF